MFRTYRGGCPPPATRRRRTQATHAHVVTDVRPGARRHFGMRRSPRGDAAGRLLWAGWVPGWVRGMVVWPKRKGKEKNDGRHGRTDSTVENQSNPGTWGDLSIYLEGRVEGGV